MIDWNGFQIRAIKFDASKLPPHLQASPATFIHGAIAMLKAMQGTVGPTDYDTPPIEALGAELKKYAAMPAWLRPQQAPPSVIPEPSTSGSTNPKGE